MKIDLHQEKLMLYIEGLDRQFVLLRNYIIPTYVVYLDRLQCTVGEKWSELKKFLDFLVAVVEKTGRSNVRQSGQQMGPFCLPCVPSYLESKDNLLDRKML